MNYYKNLELENIKYIDDDGISKIEEWKDIEDYEQRYHVSDLGRIKSISRLRSIGNGGFHTIPTRILKQTPDRDKYLLVGLRKPGTIQIKAKVHRLVAIAFIPNPNNLPEVNHIGEYSDGKEGNKNDNRAISLKWDTHADNLKHANDNSITPKGEAHGACKLTEKQVLEIRSSKLTHIALSEIYGVNRPTITKIINRQRWKHI